MSLIIYDALLATPSYSGTLQQCGSTIDHLKRIIKHKAPSLNQHNAKRRIPRLVLQLSSLRLSKNAFFK